MNRAFVVRDGDPYDNGADYLSDERLVEILRCVKDTERLPDLSVMEEADLLGEHKLIWDWNHRDPIPHLYWLTERGEGVLENLETKGGHNA